MVPPPSVVTAYTPTRLACDPALAGFTGDSSRTPRQYCRLPTKDKFCQPNNVRSGSRLLLTRTAIRSSGGGSSAVLPFEKKRDGVGTKRDRMGWSPTRLNSRFRVSGCPFCAGFRGVDLQVRQEDTHRREQRLDVRVGL